MFGIFHSIFGFCVYGGRVEFRGSVAHLNAALGYMYQPF